MTLRISVVARSGALRKAWGQVLRALLGQSGTSIDTFSSVADLCSSHGNEGDLLVVFGSQEDALRELAGWELWMELNPRPDRVSSCSGSLVDVLTCTSRILARFVPRGGTPRLNSEA